MLLIDISKRKEQPSPKQLFDTNYIIVFTGYSSANISDSFCTLYEICQTVTQALLCHESWLKQIRNRFDNNFFVYFLKIHTKKS